MGLQQRGPSAPGHGDPGGQTGQQAPPTLLDALQGRGQAAGIAGQLHRAAVGLELPQAGQGQAQQAGDRRGEQEEQDRAGREGPPTHEQAQQQVGQQHQATQLASQLGHATEAVRRRHQPGVPVSQVGDLVGQHPGQLAGAQLSQQRRRDRQGGIAPAAHGHGLGLRGGEQVEHRRPGQARPAGELEAQLGQLGSPVLGQGAGTARAQHPARRHPHEHHRAQPGQDEGPDEAAQAREEPAQQADVQAQPPQEQGGAQEVAQLLAAGDDTVQGRLRGGGFTPKLGTAAGAESGSGYASLPSRGWSSGSTWTVAVTPRRSASAASTRSEMSWASETVIRAGRYRCRVSSWWPP